MPFDGLPAEWEVFVAPKPVPIACPRQDRVLRALIDAREMIADDWAGTAAYGTCALKAIWRAVGYDPQQRKNTYASNGYYHLHGSRLIWQWNDSHSDVSAILHSLDMSILVHKPCRTWWRGRTSIAQLALNELAANISWEQ